MELHLNVFTILHLFRKVTMLERYLLILFSTHVLFNLIHLSLLISRIYFHYPCKLKEWEKCIAFLISPKHLLSFFDESGWRTSIIFRSWCVFVAVLNTKEQAKSWSHVRTWKIPSLHCAVFSNFELNLSLARILFLWSWWVN